MPLRLSRVTLTVLLQLATGGWAIPAAAQDAAAKADLRPLSASVGAMMAADSRKSIANEPSVPSINAPVMNPIAPEFRSQSIPVGERRGAVEQMLQAHEFSFGGKSALSSSKDAGRVNGVDLDRVKMRVSRGSVLLRAQFTFN